MAQDINVLEERIPEMKTIVYKTLVDPSTVKLVGEKEKLKLFKRMGFLKPKPEEVQFESLEKFYEPFIIVNGKYCIDYYRKRTYRLEIEDDVSELVIFNHVLKPKTSTLAKIQGKGRRVELEAEERIEKEKSTYLILDRKGREVAVEEMPAAPAEEEPGKILAEMGEKVWGLEASPEKAVERIKLRVIDRPKNALRIARETFEVSEHAVVYTPVYQLIYKKVNTGEPKSLLVSGVTSKVIERKD